jgi:hypothetical protein
MRGNRVFATFHHEVGGVVGRVGTERDRSGAIGARLDQGDRGEPLGMPRGAGCNRIDDQAVAVLPISAWP